MRLTILASAIFMLLTSCYQDPLAITGSFESDVPCVFQLSETYSVELPCDSRVTQWNDEGDPGAGIIAFSGHEIFFRSGRDLFQTLGTVECEDELILDYYSTWLNGEVRVLVDERYDIPMLFIHFYDRLNDRKLVFWTESIESEEMIFCRLRSLRS